MVCGNVLSHDGLLAMHAVLVSPKPPPAEYAGMARAMHATLVRASPSAEVRGQRMADISGPFSLEQRYDENGGGLVNINRRVQLHDGVLALGVMKLDVLTPFLQEALVRREDMSISSRAADVAGCETGIVLRRDFGVAGLTVAAFMEFAYTDTEPADRDRAEMLAGVAGHHALKEMTPLLRDRNPCVASVCVTLNHKTGLMDTIRVAAFCQTSSKDRDGTVTRQTCQTDLVCWTGKDASVANLARAIQVMYLCWEHVGWLPPCGRALQQRLCISTVQYDNDEWLTAFPESAPMCPPDTDEGCTSDTRDNGEVRRITYYI